MHLVPVAAGVIVGIGNVTLKFTDDFELSGIALGTIIVLTGYHLLRLMAPDHMKQPTGTPLLDGGTTDYDDSDGKRD
nr:hypothetical protein KPHV_80910 [Kitasatospora purpeofusca]